jgi:hypothetical protein
MRCRQPGSVAIALQVILTILACAGPAPANTERERRFVQWCTPMD